MPRVGENEEQNDDNELKTSNLVKEQETKAIREDLARLEKTLEDERKRNEEYLTSLRYLQADFENYRKRVDREIRELEEFSTLGLVRKLIPVLDDLDLAVATAGKAEDKVQGNDSSDKVIEEMRKGYTFKGKVLRPSAVKVELAARKEVAKGEQH